MNCILGFDKIKNQIDTYLEKDNKICVDFLCINNISIKDNIISANITVIEFFQDSHSADDYFILARCDKEYNLCEIIHTTI